MSDCQFGMLYLACEQFRPLLQPLQQPLQQPQATLCKPAPVIKLCSLKICQRQPFQHDVKAVTPADKLTTQPLRCMEVTFQHTGFGGSCNIPSRQNTAQCRITMALRLPCEPAAPCPSI